MPAAARTSDRKAVLDVLSALEFGTKKEEADLLDGVLGALGLKPRRKKEAVAAAVLEGPGLERFILEVLKGVRPFALMLKEIYTFLNRTEAIVRRRASIFRVSSVNAAEQLDFSLDSFPRELIAALTEAERRGAVVELRFPGLAQGAQASTDWFRVEANQAWNAISPRWDNDFYDDGFHRALSYAHMLLPRADEAAWARLREIVEPLLDRLASIVVCANSIQLLELQEGYFSAHRDSFKFQPAIPEARIHRVRCDDARLFLQLPTKDHGTVLDELRWHLYSMVVAIHLFRNEHLRREDRDDWLQKRVGRFSPEAYLALMEGLAATYRENLDRVAPVVEENQETVIEERLLEFLLLPFWKHRWFLYELWTLTRVIEGASRRWTLELEGLEETEPGIVEWKLPGGTATVPVAVIGDGDRDVLCWTQRKTFHPGTGEGLEPDLRLTTSSPAFHDVVIIENKDRRKPPGAEMGEIARRYVEGTCAESFWLVNYDTFTPKLREIETLWPYRRVHVVSEFRPGQVPQRFDEELLEVLARHLGPPAPLPQTTIHEAIAEIDITLTWGARVADLDLHVWVEREDGIREICFTDRGRLDGPPFAELDEDVRRGNGQETVKVLTAGLRSLSIAVYNYSNEKPISESEAEVVVDFGGVQRSSFTVPRNGFKRWWIVVDYDHAQSHVKAVNVLGDAKK